MQAVYVLMGVAGWVAIMLVICRLLGFNALRDDE